MKAGQEIQSGETSRVRTLEEIKIFCKGIWLTEIDDKEAQEIYDNQYPFFASYYVQQTRFRERWLNNPLHTKQTSKF